jgi:hypothetical protein
MDQRRPLLHPVREARRMMGDIGNTKFYQLAGRGEFKILKIGRKSVVSDDDVVAFRDRLLKQK